MLQFLTRLFAVVGFLLVLLISGIIGVTCYVAERPKPEPKTAILELDLDKAIIEQNQPSPFDFALDEEPPTPLYDILQAIDRARNDPRIRAIVAHFGSTQPTLPQGQEIRAALARFHESGKPTYAFAASYGNFGDGSRGYYLASAFDNIWLQPYGSLSLTGVAVEMPFAKSALAKVGVSGDFLQREEYKSAMDNVTRDSFAPPVKVETQAMIDDFASQVASGVAESRKMTADQVRQLMAKGPYTDEEALKANLVTHIGYADELDKEIDAKAGKDTPHISVERYLTFAPPSSTHAAKVALIYGEGLILDKDDDSPGVMGDETMGADKVSEAFDDAADAPDVKAILFRINSPGGSPDASETIRRALMQAQKKGKPVIVSMGDVAASGGYWVAMNADSIIAEPATMTGSIGVFSGKIVMGGLMQKLGVNWETLRTTDSAGMWSELQQFSPAQIERMNALLDETYHAFTKNVSDARKIPIEKMPDIAKGRVWLGDQALKIGLVDRLGGYQTAFDSIREKLKLDKKAPLNLEVFPPPETPFEKLKKALKDFKGESASLGFGGPMPHIASLLGFLRQISSHPVELLSPTVFETVR